MKILVTGCAGFIGFHLANKLSQNKNNIIFGIDNVNNYYDIKLKKDRLKILKQNKNFKFSKFDITSFTRINSFFKKKKIDIVIHLAAQAGVRYSITNSEAYVKSNLIGFYNIIENSRLFKIKKFFYASTSSVYGDSNNFPLSEFSNTNNPKSFYAATKKSNEVLAYSYYEIFKFKAIGLRFFTVYGEFGRPDMALFKFTKCIIENKKIELFNGGDHVRDFTYISDVVESIRRLITKKFDFPEIFNISSSNPQQLKKFLKITEQIIGKKAKIINKKMQKGDVYKTHGDSKKLQKKINFLPSVDIDEGIKKFINWYKKYYKLDEKNK